DGSVYAVDTSNGGLVWTSPFLPPSAGTGKLQGGVNVWLQAVKSLSICGVSTSDVVFAGTKDTGTTTGNKVYALNGSGGNVTTTGGGRDHTSRTVAAGGILCAYTGTAMDIISFRPYVDFRHKPDGLTSRSAAVTA